MNAKITLGPIIQITIKVWLGSYGIKRTGHVLLIIREMPHFFPEFA